MSEELNLEQGHPKGEAGKEASGYPAPHRIDTFGGSVEVRWSEEGGMSLNGPLAYFVEFLKVSGLWERFVARCPLKYKSPNAPKKEEILGTLLFSVLAGHRRYAHIAALRSDNVLAELLGIETFRSEDAVRRAFEKEDEGKLTLWMDLSMNETYEALLEREWVLDVDGTVKTLYGKQEEAKVGYNPMKPGRPSHVYHTMLFTAAKLVVNVDVQAGNQTASAYGQPTLWGWLDAREEKERPWLVRGDCGHGSEEMMKGCEERGLTYLFKLKKSKGVSELIRKLGESGEDWRPAGQGWEASERGLRLQGWSRERRVVVQRRRMERPPEAEVGDEGEQLSLPGMAIEQHRGEWYEYGALVTNWEETDLLAVSQMYRDRGDAENQFDELKNQWGWRGYATADLKRSQLMARMVGLFFNWWSIFTRSVTGARHGEAVTTRPMMQGVAKQTTHGNQRQLTITSVHARGQQIAQLLHGMSEWIGRFRNCAEQLAGLAKWSAILCGIFQDFAGFNLGRTPLQPRLAPSNCRI